MKLTTAIRVEKCARSALKASFVVMWLVVVWVIVAICWAVITTL